MKAVALLLAVFVASSSFEAAEPENPKRPHLALFVVSEKPVVDGRFIDTLGLPKCGYIGKTPDLEIQQLTHVTGFYSRTKTLRQDNASAQVKTMLRSVNGNASSEARISDDQRNDSQVSLQIRPTHLWNTDHVPPPPMLLIELTEKDVVQFAKLTKNNHGRKLAFVYENEVLMAPMIMMPSLHARFQITSPREDVIAEIDSKLRKLVPVQ